MFFTKRKKRILYEEALDEVNRIRKDLGRPLIAELPKGKLRSPKSCPLANALSNGWNASVNPGSITLLNDKNEFHITWIGIGASDFINAFDKGKYPELVE